MTDTEKTEVTTALQAVIASQSGVVDGRQLYRKIDFRIIPLMFLCYFFQFLDKVVVNYANVMGLQKSLGMHGQDFSWMATAFFMSYALAEFAQATLLQRFPVSKVLGLNVCVWGLALCCSAVVRNFAGLLALRVLLGACESVVAPALVLVTSAWYTKRQACARTGLWYCSIGVAQILGGLVSFVAQHGSADNDIAKGAFGGWRIMFLAVGAFNLLVAVAVLMWLPDTVDAARFLTPGEKAFVQATLALDQGGNGRQVFRPRALVESLADPAVWLLFFIVVLTVIPSGVIVTFSATLINGFGYTAKQSALLNMPSGVVSIVATLLSTFAILRGVPRWLSILAMLVPTMIGAGLMSFWKGQGGSLAGIYLLNFTVAPMALVFSMVGSNTSGYTKKVTAFATLAIAFSIANIIGPQTFQSHEAPGYISAKITLLATNGAAIFVTLLLRILYGRRNRKTEKARNEQLAAVARGETAVESLIDDEDLTDRKNPAFRYVY
ncbi:major facilitator superfamily domain-containing protein [Apiospora arundinis]